MTNLIEEKIQKLKTILYSKYEEFNQDLINRIISETRDITIEDMLKYIENYEEESNNLSMEQLDNFANNITPVIAIMFSNAEIVEMFSQFGSYTEIVSIIEEREKFGLELKTTIDFNSLFLEAINSPEWYGVFDLYNSTHAYLTEETKKRFLTNYKEKALNVFVPDDTIDGCLDLVKFAYENGDNLSVFNHLFSKRSRILSELFVQDEYGIIKKYLEVATEEEKKVIESIFKLKELNPITEEDILEVSLGINDIAHKRVIRNVAVCQGYMPTLDNFLATQYEYNDVVDIIVNKNIMYAPFAIQGFYNNEEKIAQSLDSELKKQAFNYIKRFSFGNGFFGTSKIVEGLVELLKEENISKYFDENGYKKEFLFDLMKIHLENKNEYSDTNFANVVYQDCLSQLTKEEKAYYGLLTSLLSKDYFQYNTESFEIVTNLITSSESLQTFLSNNNNLIKLLQENERHQDILMGFIRIGAINQEVKDALYLPNQQAAIDFIKECFDNNISIWNNIETYKDIFSMYSTFFVNQQPTKDLYTALLHFARYHLLLSSSNRFVSDEQKAFLKITSSILTNNYDDNDVRVLFIRDAFTNKEKLKMYISNGQPTTILIDRLFQIGSFDIVTNIEHSEELLSEKQKLIIDIYKQIKEPEIKEAYTDFITRSLKAIYEDRIKNEVLEKIIPLLEKINLSNSSEVAGRYTSIAKLILENCGDGKTDPMEKFAKIEKIFLTSDLSHVDKIFKSFQLLYSHEKLIETILQNSDRVSPTLYKYADSPDDTVLGKEARRLYGDSTYAVEAIMYADLLKTTIASNDRTFSEYIDNINKGNLLFTSLIKKEKTLNSLEAEEEFILRNYTAHLESLHNRHHPNNKITLSGALKDDLETLINLYQNVDMSLIPDAIIKDKYQAYLGILTMADLQKVMAKSKAEADKKGRCYAYRSFTLEQGDLIKGIGNIKYLDTIIQNGSVSKEFLGGDAESDYTPFDTDLSYVQIQEETLEKTLNRLDASRYGPIYFILKNKNINEMSRFNCSRLIANEKFNLEENFEIFRKMELFRTAGDNHFGIRTGFASTQIDYIYCEEIEPLVAQTGLILAKNGFYIPIINKEGKLVFTPEQFDHLRSKMNGMSYYGMNEYHFSDTLSSTYTESLVEAISQNIVETKRQKQQLEERLRQGFADANRTMKINIDGDMTPGSVELIDTGSTSRGTNQIGDGDFDYTVRLDRIDNNIIESRSAIVTSVCRTLGVPETTMDLRKAKVMLDDCEVEVDISYTSKSDRITYTTDMCLTDCLDTIKKQDPNKHLLVLSNIVLAKNILKKAECYKPHHASENPQGGLGGVGTENWILQNGGSLEEATIEFLTAAGVLQIDTDEKGHSIMTIDETKEKSHAEFKYNYSIWDFGQNQLSESRFREFPHDNFVWNNMDASGYTKMVKALQTYMLELHPEISFIPKPVPQQETPEQRIEREQLSKVSDSVRGLLHELVPKYDFNQDIDTSIKAK